VPEERGNSGLAPGIHVYDANGKPYMRDGSNVFGSHDQFQSDAEGIALYRCYDGNIMDTGRGFIVVSDQNVTDLTDFEIFDRATWRYLGNFNIEKVINTDGVAVLETALPGYPDGIFSAVHDDQGTAILGWREIFGALDISCESADSNPQDHR
jgi:myo-inositol-hexaphosphate 3-phosphohydrolase